MLLGNDPVNDLVGGSGPDFEHWIKFGGGGGSEDEGDGGGGGGEEEQGGGAMEFGAAEDAEGGSGPSAGSGGHAPLPEDS